jgi:hypothetical protein
MLELCCSVVQNKEFECIDPRGMQVVCFEELWGHAALVGKQGVVKAVIENPDFINRSKTEKRAHLYYKRLILPTIGDTYIRAVIELRGLLKKRKWGFFKTALPCNGETEGEERLWTKGE